MFAAVSCASIACAVLSAPRPVRGPDRRAPGPLQHDLRRRTRTTSRRRSRASPPGVDRGTSASRPERRRRLVRNGPTSHPADHDRTGSNHSLPKPKRASGPPEADGIAGAREHALGRRLQPEEVHLAERLDVERVGRRPAVALLQPGTEARDREVDRAAAGGSCGRRGRTTASEMPAQAREWLDRASATADEMDLIGRRGAVRLVEAELANSAPLALEAAELLLAGRPHLGRRARPHGRRRHPGAAASARHVPRVRRAAARRPGGERAAPARACGSRAPAPAPAR